MMMKEAQDEQRQIARAAEIRHERIEHEFQGEEHEIGVLAADVVGRRGPEEAAGHVEDAEKPDEAAGGGGGDAAREHFLAHRRSLAEHADAGRHVHAQHDPDHQNCGVFSA